MGRFSYEFNEFSGLFKFYDNNNLAYFDYVKNEDCAKELAEQLIQEIKILERIKNE